MRRRMILETGEEVFTPTMDTLLHELRRAARSVPIETATRWHAWRLDRARCSERHHDRALQQRLADARKILATR